MSKSQPGDTGTGTDDDRLSAENEALRRQVAELKQAHQESEARFQSLVGGSIQGILIHKRFEPRFSNHAAAVMFGFDNPDQVTALPTLLDLVAPSERLRMEELGARRRRGDDVPEIYEIECRRRDGTTLWVEHIGSLIDWLGEIVTLSILVDITKRKELDQMKNEFISTVSHELRTPLTSIRGSLGLVAGGAVGDMTEQAKELIGIAEQNCERLIRLVNDILDMEKIESGRMEYDFDVIDLSAMTEEMIRTNAAYGAEFDVQFVKGGEYPDALVEADSARLSQVFANLLSNAAKFSPRGETVEVSLRRRGDRWRVGVKNKGAGVPEAFREHIFEKFSQADGSDTRQAGGTGLGLSISRAIVEKHGGRLDFLSEPGKGATFYFDLPVWEPDMASEMS